MSRAHIARIKNGLAVITVAVLTSPALAQVSVSVGNAGSNYVNNKANILYGIVAGALGIASTIGWSMAAYKFMFVENTKLWDLKGLFIGGLIGFGAATFSALQMS